jgi:hypothetical protein
MIIIVEGCRYNTDKLTLLASDSVEVSVGRGYDAVYRTNSRVIVHQYSCWDGEPNSYIFADEEYIALLASSIDGLMDLVHEGSYN